ncbi:MAG: hypothetical protein H7Y36_01315 [Armatimonadetes bacterium]|nr:hypothetical protein [Akkermansiaceae bacterium]
MRAIDEAFELKLSDTHSLILGAGGGAGQAIATQCALQKPAKLTLVNRSLDKIIALASRLQIISSDTKIFTLTFDDPNLIEYCHAADLLVQTTSLGLQKNDPPVIPASHLLATHRVYDTIYQPAETPFLMSARLVGCRTENGLSLLLHQGVIAFQHWFPGTDPIDHMRATLKSSANKEL